VVVRLPRHVGIEDLQSLVRQCERLAGQAFGAGPVTRTVRGEAPVGEDPGLLAHGRTRLPRRTVVALRVGPVTPAVVDLRELVLEGGPRGSRRLGCGGLVAFDRAAVVAVQHVDVAHGRGGVASGLGLLFLVPVGSLAFLLPPRSALFLAAVAAIEVLVRATSAWRRPRLLSGRSSSGPVHLLRSPALACRRK